MKRYIKQKITAAIEDNDIQVYMNTWANYNEYGADGVLTPADWMSIDEALEYCKKYAEYEPFINDTDISYEGIGDNINEYSPVVSTLEMLKRFEVLGSQEKEMINAYFDTESNDFDAALEAVENHNYQYYEANSDSDLGYAVIEEDYGDNIPAELARNYFDYEAFGRELTFEGFKPTNTGYVRWLT